MFEHLDQFPVHEPRSPSAPLALEGVRVLEFTHFLAGPFGTMLLGDMGAEVIKVETPGRGDEFRHYPPFHKDLPAQGAPYSWANRNKKSVALDLKNPEGLEVARRLVESADVVVENFSTGVMARFGLDYEGCRQVNPKIIYCSVSAYGREGEFSDRMGFDPIVQAESGFISMNGYADREGVRTLSPVMDISTAMMACNGILAALVARGRTGVGQKLDVSLIDTAIMMTGYAAMQHLYSDKDPSRNGNVSPDTCPSGVFHAQDKAFYFNCGNDKMYQRLMREVLERPDLADHPIYSQRHNRLQYRDELFEILESAFGKQPWAYWQSRMRAAAVPCGEVRTLREALRSPEARSGMLVTRIPHRSGGFVPNVAMPLRFSGTPNADPRPAPAVGEDTREVLRDLLGLGSTELDQLQASGAIGACDGCGATYRSAS